MSDLLARCLDEVEAGRPVGEVLAECGEHAAELAPLIEVATRLRRAAPPAPSIAFRAASRARLMARIGALPARPGRAGANSRANGTSHLNGRANGTSHLNGHANGTSHLNGHAGSSGRGSADVIRPPPWRDRAGALPARRRPSWVRALPKLAAACLLVSTLVGGTVAVAADSLPGDVLYPAKIAVERVQLATTADDADRARLHLQFADRRAVELEKKIDHLDEASATRLANQYAAEVAAAATSLQKASRQPDPAVQGKVAEIGTRLVEETALKNNKLDQIAEQKPSVEQPIRTARVVAERAVAVQPGPTAAAPSAPAAAAPATATDPPPERPAAAPTLVAIVTVALPPSATPSPPAPTATARSSPPVAAPRPSGPVGQIAIVPPQPPPARPADAAAPTDTPVVITPMPPPPSMLLGISSALATPTASGGPNGPNANPALVPPGQPGGSGGPSNQGGSATSTARPSPPAGSPSAGPGGPAGPTATGAATGGTPPPVPSSASAPGQGAPAATATPASQTAVATPPERLTPTRTPSPSGPLPANPTPPPTGTRVAAGKGAPHEGWLGGPSISRAGVV